MGTIFTLSTLLPPYNHSRPIVVPERVAVFAPEEPPVRQHVNAIPDGLLR